MFNILLLVIWTFSLEIDGTGKFDGVCQVLQYSDVVIKSASSDFCYRGVNFTPFEQWNFSKPLLSSYFAVDSDTRNFVREVTGVLFSRSRPTPFSTSVQFVAWSDDVISNLLDLDPEHVTKDLAFLDFASGNTVKNSDFSLTERYGGHQFDVWAGQLGDGRAHLLGEYISQSTGQRWELQLKGSGKTPYSRDGDGRAVLRSSIREFLASEAMHYLGIPTIRCATLVVSNDRVKRDELYNGLIYSERTAVVLRVSPSWFRIGTLELLTRLNEHELLHKLADFLLLEHFNEFNNLNNLNRYCTLFEAIVKHVAMTTAQWMSIGFVHGVLNTDNISLLGLTLDYGPFCFMDFYDPELVPNSSDDEHLYSYERQSIVMNGTLYLLLAAFTPLLSSPTELHCATIAAEKFFTIYEQELLKLFRRKIGLETLRTISKVDVVDALNDCDDAVDWKLIKDLMSMMADQKADFTAMFRQLGDISLKTLHQLTDVSSLPWALKQTAGHRHFKQWLNDYTHRLAICGISEQRRRHTMNSVNPRYVARNWMIQRAISEAEHDDFSQVRSLLKILQHPFDYQIEAEVNGYSSPVPSWAHNLTVSCSS